ncbi:GIY-YIG nuclease family protein [Pelagibacterium sp. H642]|uniref:GIY-YIG nuclease family protein n=1 Tax=Pelagibacterium sp. H642 TaxID=1881069 RepID=UPI002815090C|nr:GIY-YIG nuclease family protein [Pelagibacterium sp. H642]
MAIIDEKQYFVYILASGIGRKVYVGVINNLFRRIPEHKAGKGGTYTRENRIDRLVYYEVHTDVAMAILREKRIKRWSRRDKVTMIERENPNWVDLFPRLRP